MFHKYCIVLHNLLLILLCDIYSIYKGIDYNMISSYPVIKIK